MFKINHDIKRSFLIIQLSIGIVSFRLGISECNINFIRHIMWLISELLKPSIEAIEYKDWTDTFDKYRINHTTEHNGSKNNNKKSSTHTVSSISITMNPYISNDCRIPTERITPQKTNKLEIRRLIENNGRSEHRIPIVVLADSM